LSALLSLRTIVAPFLVLTFPVSGPSGLVDGGNLAVIGEAMRATRGLNRERHLDSFRIEAAGRESPTMRDLARRLASVSGLRESAAGECVVRIRPNPERHGWDALVRLSALPLSARAWRVRGYHAAVNATIAAAMVQAQHTGNGTAGSRASGRCVGARVLEEFWPSRRMWCFDQLCPCAR
jgi:hypothetical protein